MTCTCTNGTESHAYVISGSGGGCAAYEGSTSLGKEIRIEVPSDGADCVHLTFRDTGTLDAFPSDPCICEQDPAPGGSAGIIEATFQVPSQSGQECVVEWTAKAGCKIKVIIKRL